MQLPLDLAAAPAARLANFVPGPNQEALAAAQRCAAGELRALYLWGARGTGRSHLLTAIAAEQVERSGMAAPSGQAGPDHSGWQARALGQHSPIEQFVFDPDIQCWLVDDVEQLDRPRQEAAFHLFNAVMAHPGAVFVAAGSQPPARLGQLGLMPELATRLGYGLVMQLQPLAENDIATALKLTLHERGLSASAELIPWLLTHAPRNLGQLRGLIDALDRYALARHRALTIPLLRDFERDAQGLL